MASRTRSMGRLEIEVFALDRDLKPILDGDGDNVWIAQPHERLAEVKDTWEGEKLADEILEDGAEYRIVRVASHNKVVKKTILKSEPVIS